MIGQLIDLIWNGKEKLHLSKYDVKIFQTYRWIFFSITNSLILLGGCKVSCINYVKFEYVQQWFKLT